MSEERIMIFIDGSNFYHGIKENIKGVKEKDIDFQKLGKLIAGKRKLIRIYYYNAPLDRTFNQEKYKKQQQFFDKLGKTPNLKLILVRMQKRKLDGKIYYVVKGDDIHIATDMIVLASKNAYDTAVLVSGDGDFVPAIKAVQELGKQVENCYFKTGHSWHLRQTCDKSFLMDNNMLKKCV
ncbi:MAG: NYN domain-containing protein [Nanoarchaeota archaeon]|nr:NYN domain-containing protein [Nanoarchaeota archaeon]MBU1135594.1 NYN domain-containing protein [Nanoarchaeota archaeon]MBU2520227.1 NYN domain-containing protein [Nanoarchaeota archaeon]